MEAEGCEGEGREKKNPLQISDLQGIDNFLNVKRLRKCAKNGVFGGERVVVEKNSVYLGEEC